MNKENTNPPQNFSIYNYHIFCFINGGIYIKQGKSNGIIITSEILEEILNKSEEFYEYRRKMREET